MQVVRIQQTQMLMTSGVQSVQKGYGTAVSGGTWRLPSVKDWEYVFIGCSGESYDEPYNGMAKSKIALTNKLNAIGTQVVSDQYWSSTKNGTYYAWIVNDSDDNIGFWAGGDIRYDYTNKVRAVLAF